MNIPEQLKYGESLLNEGNFSSAVEVFEKILDKDKLNYITLNYLAIAYSTLKKYDKAVDILNEAIESNSSSPNAYLNLAIILFQKGDKEESLIYYKLAIERDTTNTTAYYNYAVALNELRKYDEAKLYYEKAIELKNDNYSARYNLGLIDLLLGNFKSGWNGYEFRDKSGVVKKRTMPGEKWDGKSIPNKILYVYPDQGFGDTIQFVRFLPIIKKKVGKLILECQPSLLPLLENISGFDEIVKMDESLNPVRQYDFYLPITSLGKILDLNENSTIWDKPYIQVNNKSDTDLLNYFKNITEKKIGIVWRSNSNYKDEKKRTISINDLEKIFSIKENKYFSLQMEPTTDEISILKKYDVIDLSQKIKNFNDTAKIIDQLNLIISSDTAVPHLAGAMGKPTWLLLSTQPDWRWQLKSNESFWYPSIVLFRQQQKNDWDRIIDKICTKLSYFGKINLDKSNMINENIFTNEGLTRFKIFLRKIQKDAYPETPLEFHTQISDKMLEEMLDKFNFPQNTKILDIGCGQGLALKKFTEFGYNPVGITLNQIGRASCRERV